MKAWIKMLYNLLRPEKVDEDLERKVHRIRQEREEAERLLKEAQATLNGEEAWFLELREQLKQQQKRGPGNGAS